MHKVTDSAISTNQVQVFIICVNVWKDSVKNFIFLNHSCHRLNLLLKKPLWRMKFDEYKVILRNYCLSSLATYGVIQLIRNELIISDAWSDYCTMPQKMVQNYQRVQEDTGRRNEPKALLLWTRRQYPQRYSSGEAAIQGFFGSFQPLQRQQR